MRCVSCRDQGGYWVKTPSIVVAGRQTYFFTWEQCVECGGSLIASCCDGAGSAQMEMNYGDSPAAGVGSVSRLG